MTTKSCSRCGRSFGCHQEGGCWCTDLPVGAEGLAWIKARYANCLCPACLTAVAAGGRNEEPPHAT